MISGLELLIFVIVALLISIVSAMAGGGGGFILTPLLIFLGLTPAQAVSTGKFGGLAVSIGTIATLRKHKIPKTKLVGLLAVIALVIGLIAPTIITSLNQEKYQALIGIFLIALSVIMLINKTGHQRKDFTKKREILGVLSVSAGYFLVAIFSGGLGVIVNVSLMGLLGFNAIDAILIKRITHVILNVVIIIGVIFAGLVVWKVVIVGFVCNFIGSVIGSHIALKKGSRVVAILMAGMAFLAGLGLIITA